jgi:ABC-2 type transport system ATP-binding protein
MTTSLVIETHGLTKRYGSVDAVHRLNLAVKSDSITAVLGRNGAGKSTTIKMLLGITPPSEGEGRILGRRIDRPDQSREMRRRVAYVAENKPLYGYMTVEQTVRFARSFYADWREERAGQLLKAYGLPLDRKVRSLSKGMRTKLALLLAFARQADLVILDEPSEGLDPVGIEELLLSLVGLSAEGTAIFFSSHQIAEVERIADYVCIVDKGRLLVDASLDHLRESYRRVDAVFPSEPADADLQVSGVASIRRSGCQLSLFASRNADAVVKRAHDLHATSVEVAPVSLRDIFLETVKED